MRDAILLHPTDSVCVAARDFSAGAMAELPLERLRLLDDVNQGHKIARATIQPGEPILKWGQAIGFATRLIEPGLWVHSHNMAIGALTQECERSTAVPDDPPPRIGDTFQGFRRSNGRVGTRNYIAVIASVNCSAHVCRQIAAHFTRERLAGFPNIDGVISLTHEGGCGRPDYTILQRTLSGMARHPNVGGYLMVGLGCEGNQLGDLSRDF